MAVMDDIKNIPYRLFAPDPPGLLVHDLKGVPGNVQRFMDETAAATGKKIWRGMVHSIGTGLGKGIIIAAVIAIGVTALGLGFEAAAAGGAFMPGFGAGLAEGFRSLFSPGGAIWLGTGAVLGSIMEIRHNQSKISAEIAKSQAASFEAIRLQKQVERGQDMSAALSESSFAARELAKRDVAQTALAK